MASSVRPTAEYYWGLVKGFTRLENSPVSEARAAMRVTSMVAGLALLLAACGGGGKKAANESTPAAPRRPGGAPPAAPDAAGGGGTTHDVSRERAGSNYNFTPPDPTIRGGEVVTSHKKGGAPHNVSFGADSAPAG